MDVSTLLVLHLSPSHEHRSVNCVSRSSLLFEHLQAGPSINLSLQRESFSGPVFQESARLVETAKHL